MNKRQAWQSHYTFSFLLLYALLVLAAVRVCFFWINSDELKGDIPLAEYGWMVWYGIRADTTVALLMVLPAYCVGLLFLKKGGHLFRQLLCAYYVFIVLLVATISVVDIIYFNSNHRRLTLAAMRLMPDNAGLLLPYMKVYWYMVLLLLLIAVAGLRVAQTWIQRTGTVVYGKGWYLTTAGFYCGLLFLTAYDFNTRYFFTTSSGYFVMNSNYVPFSANTITELFASRRYRKLDAEKWRFMQDERAFLVHPVVQTIKNNRPNKKNIVIFIIESASAEDFQENSQRTMVVPFLDSLMKQSLVFDNFYSNGLTSPSGFDAIIGGIPEGIEGDFFHTGLAYNHTQWFTQVLKANQYSTYFFYGVRDFSQSFLKSSKNYHLDNDFGYRKYHASNKDYDSYYGIYDHVFFPAVAGEMAHINTPFASVIYNVSTHAPFNLLPSAVMDTIPAFGKSNSRSLRYYDNVMRNFFAAISTQPWFSNTLFIFVADHLSRAVDSRDKSVVGRYKIPMFIYAAGQGYKGHYAGVAEQIDIPVTLLELTGAGGKFFSYGSSVFDPGHKGIAFNKSGNLLQAIDDEYLLQYNFITRRVQGYYQYRLDTALASNLYAFKKSRADSLLLQLQAFWQVYAVTLNTNKMHPDNFLQK